MSPKQMCVARSCGLALVALLARPVLAQVRFMDQVSGAGDGSIQSRQDSIRQAILNGQVRTGGPKLKNHGPLPDPAQLVLPHWNSSFRTEGVDYPFTVIGGDPSANQTTTIPVVIIPYRFHFADGTVIDATTDLIDGVTPLNAVLASPIFNDTPIASGPTALGTTQWGDAYMRGNFWSLHGGEGSGYHVRLQAVFVTPVVSIEVPPQAGFTLTFGGEKIGVVDYEAMGELAAQVVGAFGIPPSFLTVHLSGELVKTTPAYGSILGFHDIVGLGGTTPGLGTFIETGFFPRDSVLSPRFANVTVLAHEVVEWLHDPVVSNQAPMWVDPGQGFCWNWLLEVADPLESLAGTEIVRGGFQYHFPDVAFLPWFARVSSKYSVNGWYSLNNSVTSAAQPCPAFFQPYVTFYFPNGPGMDSARLTGLNDRGQATGFFTAGGAVTSFVLGNLDFLNPSPPPISFDVVNVPGSLVTFATKINDLGQVVGVWVDGAGREHGFLLRGGQYTSVDVPGAIATEALALNSQSNLTIAGDYVDAAGAVHGFTLRAGVFKGFDVPLSTATAITGINDSNGIVGRYRDPAGNVRGFVGNPGSTNPLDFPGAIQDLDTLPGGINGAGHVAGTTNVHASPPRPAVPVGFLWGSGTFLQESPTLTPTTINDINDADFYAGSFVPPGSGPTAMIGVPSRLFRGAFPASGMVQLSLPPGAFTAH